MMHAQPVEFIFTVSNHARWCSQTGVQSHVRDCLLSCLQGISGLELNSEILKSPVTMLYKVTRVI